MKGQSQLERYAPYAAGVLLAAPVLVARYPPMTDLPLHEGLVGILRHFNDAAMFPQGLYEKNLGEPNQLFHLVAWALSYLFATDFACKLTVALAVFAIPVCAARFASHVGASRLSALVVAPIALGWLFTWGLVANLIGLAALLALLPALDELAASPSWRRALPTIAGAVLLYFAHEAMMFVYAGAALMFALIHPLSWKGTALRLVPFAAAGLVAYSQIRYQARFLSPAVKSVPALFIPVDEKLARVPDMLFQSGESVVQLAFFGLILLTMAVMLALRRRERAALPQAPPSVRRLLLRYRFELFAAACFVAFLAFPFTLNGATLVYHRFFAPAFALFAIVACPRELSSPRARVVKLLAPVMPLATLLMAWPSFAESDRAYRALDDLLPRIERGSAVAQLDLGPDDPSRSYSLGTASARVLATRGGRMLYAFTDSSIAPAVLPPAHQWNEPLLRAAGQWWNFMPEHDLKRFRYVVVRTSSRPLGELAIRALEPYASVVAASGDWLLFESKVPPVSLLSGDEVLPSPRPQTLKSLMMAAERAGLLE